MDLSLIPQFGGLLWTVLAFVVALSVIVAIHEYGHYIAGRWCGIKADVFSVGFGPVLFSRKDRHGTQWQVAALPLGGYVKFRGDANAASVGADGTVAALSPEERAQTMPGAALWKRAVTVAAGPVANFILSIAIFAAFVLVMGTAADDAVVGKTLDLPPEIPALERGDEIVAIAGTPVSSITDLVAAASSLEPAAAVPYTVRRDGAELSVVAASPLPPLASGVQPRSAAWEVGLEAGDYVRAIDGTPIHAFSELQAAVAASDGAPLTLDVWRPGEGDLTFTLVPRRMDIPTDGGFETRWLMGINGGGLFFQPPIERSGPLQAVSFGASQVVRIVETTFSALSHIVTGRISTCNLSGPIGIAETSGAAASQGIGDFIWFIALLSTAVGLLNLFPIPVLDGGHLVFHAYEAVTGKPPSDGAVRVLMTFGLGLMLALMLFALYNDITC